MIAAHLRPLAKDTRSDTPGARPHKRPHTTDRACTDHPPEKVCHTPAPFAAGSPYDTSRKRTRQKTGKCRTWSAAVCVGLRVPKNLAQRGWGVCVRVVWAKNCGCGFRGVAGRGGSRRGSAHLRRVCCWLVGLTDVCGILWVFAADVCKISAHVCRGAVNCRVLPHLDAFGRGVG